jgi:hypothetical protein
MIKWLTGVMIAQAAAMVALIKLRPGAIASNAVPRRVLGQMARA